MLYHNEGFVTSSPCGGVDKKRGLIRGTRHIDSHWRSLSPALNDRNANESLRVLEGGAGMRCGPLTPCRKRDMYHWPWFTGESFKETFGPFHVLMMPASTSQMWKK